MLLYTHILLYIYMLHAYTHRLHCRPPQAIFV
jgi:hypothetical protein